MDRRMWVGVAGWLTGVVVATTAGVAAVTVVGGDLTAPSVRPLSEEDVRRALAATGGPTPSGLPAGDSSPPTGGSSPPTGGVPPSRPVEPTPSGPAGVARVLTSSGGSTLARCVDGQVSLDWWTPQQGYRTDDVDRGPADEARVEFRSPAREVRLRIICQNGVPQLSSHD